MTQSQYPELQTILPKLCLASPRRSGNPVFGEKEEAQRFLEFLEREGERNVVLAPVWAIKHFDLEESRIVGWSVRSDVA